jgi:AraC-like DNA-binding protein
MQVITAHQQALGNHSRGTQPFESRKTVLMAGPTIKLLQETVETLYTVVAIETLAHVHTVVLQRCPDLVVIDFSTHSAEALQLCYQIKLNESINHIPVILIADSLDANAKLTGLQFGADDCVTGRYYREELIWRIRNLIQLCSNLRKNRNGQLSAPDPPVVPSADSRLQFRIMKVVEDNLGNASFSVSAFSKEMSMSQVQLYRKVLRLTGLTPNDYIRQVRLHRAAELLKLQSGSVSEIAYRVGFSNLSYFSKCFKRVYSTTPTEYARRTILPFQRLTFKKYA